MIKVPKDKFILDPCCSGKMMWLENNQRNTIYTDIRNKDIRDCGRWIRIRPDYVMDFRKLEFPDESFHLITFDPPHMFISETAHFAKKFGSLNAETWQSDLRKGFKELWRVLKPYGVIVFKWNDNSVKVDTLLKIIPYKPLIQNINTGKGGTSTYWFTFMKIPK